MTYIYVKNLIIEKIISSAGDMGWGGNRENAKVSGEAKLTYKDINFTFSTFKQGEKGK